MKRIAQWLIILLCLMSYSTLTAETEKALINKATQLNDKAGVYYEQGDYSKALKSLQQSLAIREKVLGKQHADTAESYNNIGVTYKDIGDYPKALKYGQIALAIRKKVLGKQHADTAESYNYIGSTYDAMGDSPKALTYCQKALAIRENIFGKEHLSTASSYHTIGLTYKSMGDYPKALEYQQKALAIVEKVLGKLDSDTATNYDNIGSTYNSMGNFPTALKYTHKALLIREKVLGKQHPSTAQSYNNIGLLYSYMNEYSQALKYLKKSLLINESIFGKKNYETAGSYNNISLLYTYIDNYPEALKYSQKALLIAKNILGKQHPKTAIAYGNIGEIYRFMGNYAKALEFSQQALAIEEKVLGKQHPDTAIRYKNISKTYDFMKDAPNAYNYAKKAFDIVIQQRDNNFAVLNSEQKRDYLKSKNGYIDQLLYSFDSYQHELQKKRHFKKASQLQQIALNDWLAYKGSILDSENRLVAFAKSSKNPAIQQKYQQLVTLKQAYSKLNQNLPKPENKQTWQQQLKQQQEKIATLEREITQVDPRFKTEKALQSINSKTIAKGLKATELYIDYGKTDDGYYLFTIDHQNTISFTAFSNKDSKAIDQQLALFTNDIETIISGDEIPETLDKKSKASLSQLYQLLIPPALAAKIASKDSLIISPDGGLRLLPFEALYNNAKKQYLIQQKDIRYIASGKELVRLFRQQQTKPSKNNKAVLFANPNFNQHGIEKIHQPAVIYTRNTARGKLRSGMFSPLKGTKIEAEAIITILHKTNVSHYYRENSATEANLVRIKQPNILHIATHGFFNADTPNPMLQSGLVFAGANVSIEKGTGEGIVTALDLSGLDLKGTELVVLSACETGKVDPNNTNGVSGLTKAFIQAGAKDVVMSLWSVADRETASLMQAFYRVSQTNHQQYADALKQSKLAMIKDGLHPYYWAAFVLSGL